MEVIYVPSNGPGEERGFGGQRRVRHKVHLDVGVLGAGGTPLSGTALLLAMHIEFGVAEDGHSAPSVLQGKGRTAVQLLLVLSGHRQDNGHRQVDRTA